jgi:hypothetical protein
MANNSSEDILKIAMVQIDEAVKELGCQFLGTDERGYPIFTRGIAVNE